jgi:hypothetical protein
VRADSAVAAFNDANGNLDISETTALSATYRLTEHWAPTVRLVVAGNNAPGAALDGGSIGNPMVGATYTRTMGNRRLALLAATTLPIGTGGDPQTAKTNAASITARPADEAMFEVDYVSAIAGADLAYVKRGVTLQAEAMLRQSVRVRGERDPFRTRAALGAHVGTMLGRHVSVGADLLYQRWLSHPTELDDAGLTRLTLAAGARLHVHVGKASLRPGLSYTRGLGATDRGPMMITNRTNAVTFDLPVLF